MKRATRLSFAPTPKRYKQARSNSAGRRENGLPQRAPRRQRPGGVQHRGGEPLPADRALSNGSGRPETRRTVSTLTCTIRHEYPQIPLCCPCGCTTLYRSGLYEFCYNRGRRSRFGGGRERVLERDHRTCRVCYSPAPLVVHHRRPSNRSSSLITLCRTCHARLHRLRAIDRWGPDLLETLWAEQRPGCPRQLQLPPTR